SRLVVDEAVPGVQTVDMETAARDGAQTVRLVRVCFPGRAIVYKQLDPPYPLAAHVGSWTLAPAPGGVQVTAQNTVLDN
ncbi:cyclase, partial [Klebsiella pneumoniae]|nr:cyclase [Klebsiella pneumoniae]